MKLYPIATSQLQYLETGQFIIRFLTDFENLRESLKTTNSTTNHFW